MNSKLALKLSRKDNFKDSCHKLKDYLDAFCLPSHLSSWYTYWQTFYSLPLEVIQQESRYYLSEAYSFIDEGFQKKFSLNHLLPQIFKYLAFLAYVLIKAKPLAKRKKKYSLLLDYIESGGELERFKPLLERFPSAIIILRTQLESKQDSWYRPNLKGYSLPLVLFTVTKEAFVGIFIHTFLSFKYRTNLFPIAIHFLNINLYYLSIFRNVHADYLLQERHYHTSAIKNHLFKSCGGLLTTSIQKNIVQAGHNGYYYDIDVMLSLGKGTMQRALEYGGRIGKIHPVGSMFFNHYWHQKEKMHLAAIEAFDIVYFGGNPGDFQDSYDSYLNDYYEHFQWLVKFADEFPEYKVGIKHHANNTPDPREMAIIQGTRVQRIDQKLSSYELGFKAKCRTTWLSTMSYEFFGCGLPTIFLDPGRRNYGFVEDDTRLEPWRATTYDHFKGLTLAVIRKNHSEMTQPDKENFCLDSRYTYQNIYTFFQSHIHGKT